MLSLSNFCVFFVSLSHIGFINIFCGIFFPVRTIFVSIRQTLVVKIMSEIT